MSSENEIKKVNVENEQLKKQYLKWKIIKARLILR